MENENVLHAFKMCTICMFNSCYHRNQTFPYCASIKSLSLSLSWDEFRGIRSIQMFEKNENKSQRKKITVCHTLCNSHVALSLLYSLSRWLCITTIIQWYLEHFVAIVARSTFANSGIFILIIHSNIHNSFGSLRAAA